MTDPILVVSHLARSFTFRGADPIRAVNDVSLSVTPGQIYGLVGPDGAGKTTTLRLIFGAYKADGGTVTIGGFSIAQQPEEARGLIGYLSQRFSLYEELTVLENIWLLWLTLIIGKKCPLMLRAQQLNVYSKAVL